MRLFIIHYPGRLVKVKDFLHYGTHVQREAKQIDSISTFQSTVNLLLPHSVFSFVIKELCSP